MKKLFLTALIIALTVVGQFSLSHAQQTAQPDKTRTTFVEVPSSKSKITWVHDNGKSEAHHLPETCGGGGIFFDYDNDGWMDIYLVNSGGSDFFTPKTPIRNALYHNNHDGTFTDVTEKAGVALGDMGHFGMGAAAGDYDGDGWQDLYVTNYGRNVLFHNNHDGTFTDVTDKAGVAAPNWSTQATWFDYDNDGKLDLFVSSFVEYSAHGLTCGDNRLGRHYYCIPRVFNPRPSYLFHNDGNGKFTDVSKQSGIAGSRGKSFGAVATDVNNDGLIDLFVANDTVANFLFLNKGNGKFEEVGLDAGVAYSDGGNPRSGMGVDAADVDGSGWQDLFVANIDQELFSLYINQKKNLLFIDKPGEIGQATRLLSGWGLKFFDYDNDGDPDLILANGHPDDMIQYQSAKVKYREPLLLFENIDGKFKNVSAESGEVFQKDFSGRGLSVGDFDNDGYLDVLVVNNGEPPLLLHNEGNHKNNWLGLQLIATKSNPAAVGAIINWQAGGVKRSRFKTGGGSYLASHDPREILGIGQAAKIDSVEIRWPSGQIDKLTNLPINTYIKVVEGKGIEAAPKAAH